jgi:glutamine phosphoribosylpyrophosphate amidotransferase
MKRSGDLCGLFGMAGKGVIDVDLKAFKQLGIVTQLRGLDGAGIYVDKVTGSKDKDLPIYQRSEYDFCHLLGTDYKVDVMADVFIGHCRAATVGNVTEENAHPYKHDNLVVAHNGTLWTEEFNEDTDRTDSDQMAEYMQKHGVMDALELLSHWDAYAITGVDTETGQLYLAKNDQRSFYIAIHQIRNVMYWSSEREMLELVLDRANVGKYKIFTLEDEVLHTVNISEIEGGKHSIFYKQDIVSSNPTGFLSNSKKNPSKEKEKCTLCGSDLIAADYKYGMFSRRKNGMLCEPCTYNGVKYGY